MRSPRAARALRAALRVLSGLLTSLVLRARRRRYETALDASRNFVRGNAELETTLRRSGGARRTVAIMLFGASLLLLLLDWLSG